MIASAVVVADCCRAALAADSSWDGWAEDAREVEAGEFGADGSAVAVGEFEGWFSSARTKAGRDARDDAGTREMVACACVRRFLIGYVDTIRWRERERGAV